MRRRQKTRAETTETRKKNMRGKESDMVTGEKKTEIRNQQRQRERERERDQKNMKGKERDIVTGEKKTET